MILKLLLIGALIIIVPQIHAANKPKHVICYHGTWSIYFKSLGKFELNDIDPFLCTHLMYAYVGIEESGDLRIIDPYLDLEDNFGQGNIKKFNALKVKNPTLKTLFTVGGWNEGSKNFSVVAADPTKRTRFIQAVVRFIQRYGFDGMDLDWEYPAQRHKLSENNDRKNFITLLLELKEGFDPFNYLLTAVVAGPEWSASISYDIPEMTKYLDLINIKSYDMHGPWDKVIGLHSALYADPNEDNKQLNVDAIIKYWLKNGATREKLVIGVPFYGRTFTLKNALQHSPGSPHLGRGMAGPYTVEPGKIDYNELCEIFQNESGTWTEELDENQKVSYAYNNRLQWVGFESVRSVDLKAQYVMDNDLAGIMVWSVNGDDFRGICGNGTYPLLSQINRVLFSGAASATGLTSEHLVGAMVRPTSRAGSKLNRPKTSFQSGHQGGTGGS